MTENPQRPDVIYDLHETSYGVIEKPLTIAERIYTNGFARKSFVLLLLACAWELYAVYLDNPLLFPTFSETIKAFVLGVSDGIILERTWFSIKVLLQGYIIGLICAGLLTAFAMTTRIGNDFLETLTATFNPLPAIALLPLAMIWFGLGTTSLVFVLVHSVLWAVALNTYSGFQSVSQTLRMVGRNYGLTGPRYVLKILVPAAFPSILTGMKIGWAFAWRTLIAAELVFGVSSGSGGLGWFIYENKNLLETSNVFAGLLSVILIGLIVENLFFRWIEVKTVRLWGLQS